MADDLETEGEGETVSPPAPAPVDDAAFAEKFEAFREVDPAQLVELPAVATPETHAAVLQKLGAPVEPGAYGLDKIEGVDAPTAEWADGAFRAASLLPWQANAVASAFLTHQSEMTAELAGQDNAAAKAELAMLAQEWGGDYAPRLETSKSALAALGVDHEAMQFLEGGGGIKEAAKLGAFFASFMPAEMLDRGAAALKAGASPASLEPSSAFARRWYPNA